MASTTGSTTINTATLWPEKPEFKQRIDEFLTFVYDGESQTFLGRTPKSWGQIILFYVIFYCCVIGMFFALLQIFYYSLDWNIPKLRGSNSLLRNNPGLSFRPLPSAHSTLIRWNKSRPSTLAPYVDSLQAYLQFYENTMQQTETGTIIDCGTIPERRSQEDWDKACRFDITLEFKGSNCVKQQSFGFEDGQPCVLLKLNRIFDWMPEPYYNDTVPENIVDIWSQYFITVKCEGETPTDKDNLGEIIYLPPNGFHFKYYPYRNQQGFRSPLVWVRFETPAQAQLLMVTCKAYARNIYHDAIERSGMIHFELLID